MAELLENFAGMSVLVVDDNPSNVALMQALLETQGLTRVHIEMDARQVPRRLIDDRPDLVVLDLHMPHISGFQTLARIQQHAAGGYLPVLVMTADTTVTARDRALREGAHDFLAKPIDMLEATLRISNLLRTRQLYQDLRRSWIAAADAVGESAAVAAETRSRIDAVLRERALHSVYQPVVELDGLGVVGFEALSRFDDAGLRRPDQWFSDGFAAGRGVELEWLAATKAVEALAHFDVDQFLAVNLSAATILQMSDRGPLCEPTACPQIVIELTEHVPVEDYSALHRALQPMRALGTRLAADDLGSGYAGFRHLLRLEPDIIKLDISLVGGINRSASQRSLARALISFADDVGAAIIAEGVETVEELTALQALGVRWGQGYLLGRPAPLAADAPIKPRTGAGH